MKTENKIALGVFAGILTLVYLHKQSGTSGIGAARKRRIYKELSLAQQAGVDFTKAYEELDPEEIEALERVSAETGYTETYYKSLQKAYNAVSGIGEAYDVTDADGNTVLTWIDDPKADAAEKRRIEEAKQRTLEAEARAAEARKKKRATDRAIRSGQQSLFGCGALSARDALEPELLDYVRRNMDEYDVQEALDDIGENRTSSQRANGYLYDQIYDLVNEWCVDNAIDPDSVWSLFDPEDIFWEL